MRAEKLHHRPLVTGHRHPPHSGLSRRLRNSARLSGGGALGVAKGCWLRAGQRHRPTPGHWGTWIGQHRLATKQQRSLYNGDVISLGGLPAGRGVAIPPYKNKRR